MNRERGRIVCTGMGGFLNPPTHPEHAYHVQTDVRRPPWNRGGMSLSAAVTCEWLSVETKNAAARRLEKWEKPCLDSPEIQDWIFQMLGYFRGCYRDNVKHVDEHDGVRKIREYYPEFIPTDEHFQNAYWGTKP